MMMIIELLVLQLIMRMFPGIPGGPIGLLKEFLDKILVLGIAYLNAWFIPIWRQKLRRYFGEEFLAAANRAAGFAAPLAA